MVHYGECPHKALNICLGGSTVILAGLLAFSPSDEGHSQDSNACYDGWGQFSQVFVCGVNRGNSSVTVGARFPMLWSLGPLPWGSERHH